MATTTRRRRGVGREVKMGRLHTKSLVRGKAVRKVGFFGCNNKVVRVELAEMPPKGERYPHKVRLACPACSHEHEAQPLWREYKESLDAGKDAVIL